MTNPFPYRQKTPLAPFAQPPCSLLGREHFEDSSDPGEDFELDRERIVHSTAFRRLEHKSRLPAFGRTAPRTCLSHAVEVASVSRTIARMLGLNEYLAECAALVRHLGTPPFGRRGEVALHETMIFSGGFNICAQSSRIIEELDACHPEFNGLNLTWETRESLADGSSENALPYGVLGFRPRQTSAEIQAVDLADQIVATSRDLQDGLEKEMLDEAFLQPINIWRCCSESVSIHYACLGRKRFLSAVTGSLFHLLLEDAVAASLSQFEKQKPSDANMVRLHHERLVSFSRPVENDLQLLRDHLHENFYYHPDEKRILPSSARVVEELFDAYTKNPHLLGHSIAKKVKKDGLNRIVCDAIAEMTDLEARQHYDRLIGENRLPNLFSSSGVETLHFPGFSEKSEK